MEINRPIFSFKFLLILCTATGLLFLSACNLTKLVPEGDALYTGHTVELKNSTASKDYNSVLKSDLKDLVRPKPNNKLKLALYNLAGKKNNFFSKFLRKNGQPPVLASTVNLERNIQVLTNTLENKGFFHAKVSGDTVLKGKKGSARYVADAGVQYKINEVTFPDDTSSISRAIRDISSKSILRKGDPFILDVVKGERLRIDLALKEQGYYFFNPEDLIILVDSTIGNSLTNLHVKFKPGIAMGAMQQYRINNVYIYSNYNLNTAARDTLKADSILYKGYYVIDRKKTFKPLVFEQMMRFKPGDLYNRTDHNLSLNRLINLGTFKFVKNRFEVVPDSFKLNSYYYLTPMAKKSISAEAGALSKSSNATGSEFTVRWRNRNTFKGAELLTISAYAGFEVQVSGQYSGYNTIRYGAEGNLTFPRFMIPIFKFNTKSSFVPRTNLQLGYDILQRQKLYTINSYRGQLGYIWKESAQKEHTFNPIAVNYVQPLDVQDTFYRAIDKNRLLKRVIDTQFIIGSNYNYNYNQLVNREKFATGWYFNGLLDLSGNIAGLLSGADVKNGKRVNLFGSAFSQYIKTELDFRRYIKLSLRSQWASRLIVGVGFPYGNSTRLPFVKQFFAGGSNSLRGFRSRSVGPGIYDGARKQADTLGFLPDITGDMKLEFNTELRRNLFSIVDGALFLDAGNVWLAQEDPAAPGGKFTKNFMKELAVDAGIGIRIDVTILLLRLDVATPLRKPWLPAGEQKIGFGTKDLIYNLAIGMPF